MVFFLYCFFFLDFDLIWFIVFVNCFWWGWKKKELSSCLYSMHIFLTFEYSLCVPLFFFLAQYCTQMVAVNNEITHTTTIEIHSRDLNNHFIHNVFDLCLTFYWQFIKKKKKELKSVNLDWVNKLQRIPLHHINACKLFVFLSWKAVC